MDALTTYVDPLVKGFFISVSPVGGHERKKTKEEHQPSLGALRLHGPRFSQGIGYDQIFQDISLFSTFFLDENSCNTCTGMLIDRLGRLEKIDSQLVRHETRREAQALGLLDIHR